MIDRWIDPDEYEYETRACVECEKKQELLDDAQHFLEAVIEALYSKKSLDIHLFEDHLDELCHRLKVPFPKEQIQIERKKTDLLKHAYELTKQFSNL
jgi:hypothetical protein